MHSTHNLSKIKFGKDPLPLGTNGVKRPAPEFLGPALESKRLKRDDSIESSTVDSTDGDAGPRLHIKIPARDDQSPKKKADRKDRAAALLQSRLDLPVTAGKNAILKALQENETVVILGETGSGKTTQIPQYILDSAIPCTQPRICITQPRKVATISLATRVAEEMGCKLGGVVGYTVRFDDNSSRKTRLKFVTDGTLLQEILGDTLLSRYDVVVVDEAHERTLRTDMVLGFLKQIQARRRQLPSRSKAVDQTSELGPLRVVVMSATLDAERFSTYFNNAKILYVKGRQHKVTIKYCAVPQDDYADAALRTFFNIHLHSPPGDVLVFLSGEEEIENLQSTIKTYASHLKSGQSSVKICPLYAKLPPSQQKEAFQPAKPNERKVILATNVAETSITIPGIKYVIDTGVMKQKSHHARVGVERLLITPISQSSAQQRAGRAGRESSGQCYRLYTESDFQRLQRMQAPEITRCSLSFAILHLVAVGQEDVFGFEFMDPPDRIALTTAMADLLALEALDNQRRITPLGRQMASLPLDPAAARILLASIPLGCGNEAVALVALMSFADSVLMTGGNKREAAVEAHQKFQHRDGDHLTLLNVLKAFEAADNATRLDWCKENFVNHKTMVNVTHARNQLRQRCDALHLNWRSSCADDSGPLLRALMTGLYQNCAIRGQDDVYRKILGRMVIKIHPSSVLHLKKAPIVIYSELVMTTQTYARCVSAVPTAVFKDHQSRFLSTT